MEVYEFEGFVLDAEAGRLRDGPTELSLRPKSYALLLHLLRHRGRVLGKDELLEAVWPGLTVSDESLAQCVADIRRTLGPRGGRLVRTVSGRGYLIDAEPVRLSQAVAGNPREPPKPSIAVHSFADLSPQPGHEWFARALSEELLIALSRIREITVVTPGRSSDLTAAYALEGSTRVQGAQLRATARIIDPSTGSHIWSEKFDAPLADAFAVQDEITRKVALAIQIRLATGDNARLWEGRTDSLNAWERMVEARHHFLQFNRADVVRAMEAATEAIEIDPSYTGAMVQLGLCHWWQARFDLLIDKEDALYRAEAMVALARAVDPEAGITFMLEGGIALLRDQHADAMRLCHAAMDRAQSDSHTVAFCGTVCSYSGRSEEAASLLRQAMRLSPQWPPWYGYHLALAKLWTGHADTALDLIGTYHAQIPDDPYGYAMVAFVSGFTGDTGRAARLISALMERFSEFGIRNLLRSEHYAAPERLETLVTILRQAGLRD